MACEALENGMFVCNTVSCAPPLLFHTDRCECPDGSAPGTTSYGTPLCAAPVPAPAVTAAPQCTLTLTYAAQAADVPQIVSSGIGCDAGIELALAAALTALLKGR